MKIRKYLQNCFLLLIPIFLWNLFFYDDLPKGYSGAVFEKDIPQVVLYSEYLLRVVLFGLPLLMALSVKTSMEKMGLSLYLFGMVVYFLSWILVIAFPDSAWSQSAWGFMAPAYTPLIWLIGVGLIGNQSFLRIPKISIIYSCLSAVFVFFHALHAYIVFMQL
jgi:hypothetical protein